LDCPFLSKLANEKACLSLFQFSLYLGCSQISSGYMANGECTGIWS
jgi:hypothetical protein